METMLFDARSTRGSTVRRSLATLRLRKTSKHVDLAARDIILRTPIDILVYHVKQSREVRSMSDISATTPRAERT